MSLREVPLPLTPQEAASGTVRNVSLGSGDTTKVRIPPVRHGQLIRAHVGGTEVLLRIQIPEVPAPPRQNAAAASPQGTQRTQQTQRTQKKGSRLAGVGGCLLVLGVFGGLIYGLVQLTSSDSSTTGSSAPSVTGSSAPSTTEPADPTETTEPTDPGLSSPESSAEAPVPDAPAPDAPAPDTSSADTSSEAPSPYDQGTCLNGRLPDSTTAQSVSGVDEVPCSASDAHYRVIKTFPLTSDLSRCRAVPNTQYAFSHRYTLNGATINEYVYCLVGLGSYAR
ncbi:LppU/SCO3897 family protein [Streptomyces apocyni]|uniref:LppU/SCO3897 family protein n=1 Tax=Streptomyces apocyni TaxID=2654677 RepID=UPI0012EA4152|nr:hypothetical protein [Streptomyces apocyni]